MFRECDAREMQTGDKKGRKTDTVSEIDTSLSGMKNIVNRLTPKSFFHFAFALLLALCVVVFSITKSQAMTARVAYLLFFLALLLNMSSSTGTFTKEAAFAALPQPQQPSGLNSEDQSGPPESPATNNFPQLSESAPDSKLPRIKLGETIRFEEFGPIIINTDGTTRSIENWDQLTEREQEVTWRRISKRNEERRKILLEKQEVDAASANEEL